MMYAQSALPSLAPVPAFFIGSLQQEISIRRETDPSRPFSVAGPRGAVLGQQDGTFELWEFPWKILSNLRISAEMDGYPVPIEVNRQARWFQKLLYRSARLQRRLGYAASKMRRL
jgi:hypothetical protein